MFLSKDEIIKLNLLKKRYFYKRLFLDYLDEIRRAKTVCLLGLGHWCYAKWLLEDFKHLEKKNITIMASANLRFLYKDLEKTYNLMYVEDDDYIAKCKEANVKVDFTAMNPPYQGKGDPLFMQIGRVFYEHCTNPGGSVISINPTSVSDNTYPTVSSALKSNYGGMKVKAYEYAPDLKDAFDADIGTGICITVYSSSGEHTLFDDYVRELRFGKKNWDMRKAIVENKVFPLLGEGDVLKNKIPSLSVAALPGFKKWTKNAKDLKENSTDEEKAKWEKYIKKFNEFKVQFLGKNVVVLAYNRGHANKWDWVTLQSDEYIKVQNDIPNMSQFDVPFEDKRTAIEFIKWMNTDFIMYIVSHYKTQMTNNMILFKLLPQPPAFDGNYSDEVLMKYFNLTQEEMDWIHSEMKNSGWKVNLGKTESELMEYIDEINR